MLLLISKTDARCRCNWSATEARLKGRDLQEAIAEHLEKCPHKDYDGLHVDTAQAG